MSVRFYNSQQPSRPYMLNTFYVENYRAFARPQKIEVRPLTLFFGWNSGGKSALVRFLPLIAESIRNAGPAVWLGGEIGRRSTWQELVCKNTGRNALKFGLAWGGEDPISAEWEINADLEGRWQEASILHVSNETVSITAMADEQDPDRREWKGFVPLALLSGDENSNLITRKLKANIRSFEKNVQWISGVRARPPRVTAYGGGAQGRICSDGADAIDHLVEAQLRSMTDPVLEESKRFFSALGEQLILENPIEGAWRVLLQPIDSAKTHVNLCDTGEGYTQVLPILVALAKAKVENNHIVCLEQPELHLHTKAQVVLSNMLVETAKVSGNTLLIETHSEVLMMSVQLAIAEGRINASDVRIYWVEGREDGTSDVVPIDLDEKGRPMNSAMVDAFEEVIELGQKLSRIQLSI